MAIVNKWVCREKNYTLFKVPPSGKDGNPCSMAFKIPDVTWYRIICPVFFKHPYHKFFSQSFLELNFTEIMKLHLSSMTPNFYFTLLPYV